MSAIPRDHGEPQSPHSAPPYPLLFPTCAKAGSPLSCSTAGAEGCSCWTHGQVWWPKDGEGILSWAQPRDQLLHASPVHTSQQSKNLTLCWSHLGCKAPPSSSSPQHNQEGCSQGWLWLLPQPGDALPGPPAKQRCCWDTPSSLPSPPRPAGLSQC